MNIIPNITRSLPLNLSMRSESLSAGNNNNGIERFATNLSTTDMLFSRANAFLREYYVICVLKSGEEVDHV